MSNPSSDPPPQQSQRSKENQYTKPDGTTFTVSEQYTDKGVRTIIPKTDIDDWYKNRCVNKEV